MWRIPYPVHSLILELFAFAQPTQFDQSVLSCIHSWQTCLFIVIYIVAPNCYDVDTLQVGYVQSASGCPAGAAAEQHAHTD